MTPALPHTPPPTYTLSDPPLPASHTAHQVLCGYDGLQAADLCPQFPDDLDAGVLVHHWFVDDGFGPAGVAESAQRLTIAAVSWRHGCSGNGWRDCAAGAPPLTSQTQQPEPQTMASKKTPTGLQALGYCSYFPHYIPSFCHHPYQHLMYM